MPAEARVWMWTGADAVDLKLEPYTSLARFEQEKQREARRATCPSGKYGDDWEGIIDNEMGGIDGFHKPIERAVGNAVRLGIDETIVTEYILAALQSCTDRSRVMRYDAHYLRAAYRSFELSDRSK